MSDEDLRRFLLMVFAADGLLPPDLLALIDQLTAPDCKPGED